MTIAAKVRNVRGCEHADLALDPIALVAGVNATGKSSIAQSIAAALSGETLPIEGLNKSTAGYLVRTGAGNARVEVQGAHGSVSIDWPAASPLTIGDAPGASLWATGLWSLATVSAKERARVLSLYLKADPTLEDVQAALREHEWPDDVIAMVWKQIEQQGWDPALEKFRQRGAENKGRWRQLTGVNYGSRIAGTYRPDLSDLDENELAHAVAQARRDAEAAAAAVAVSASERERLAAEAGTLEERSKALDSAQQAAQQCAEALHQAQQARLALPAVERPQTAFCPHCGAEVIIERINLMTVQLTKSDTPIDNENVTKRRMAIATADGKIAHAQDALNLARRAEGSARTAVENAAAARERIANWPKAVETGTDVEAARSNLARAEKRLAEFHVKRDADDLHQKIENNEIVLGLLAPDGLRASKMRIRLRNFVDNDLVELAQSAGWPSVEISPDLALLSHGIPYALLSTSEQYRVRTVLQLAMARLEGADAVIVDGADILDAPSRGGLFEMLTKTGIPAVVCMTLSRREQCPDLAKLELGRSYWLAGGILEPLQPERQAA
jgi:membrane protease subunit (stomatin/prohibitin family)